MDNIKLYRKRYIPDEIIYLKDDKILYKDDNKIVTEWNVLKPRNDFAKGISCYFINEGYKISKFMDINNNLVYYYCDIIEVEYNKNENSYIFNDLLVDVIIFPDGKVEVVDINEIVDALDNNVISYEIAKIALRKLDNLLTLVYSDKLFDLVEVYFDR